MNKEVTVVIIPELTPKEDVFTREQWYELKRTYKYTCLCCGRKEPKIELVADHIIPRARGGLTVIDNMQPLCRSCNARKHAKTIDYRPPARKPQQFCLFNLPGLLPDGHALVINQQARFFDHYIISQLSDKIHGLIAQQIFTEQEFYALVTLMEAWPDYCPYEHLLSALTDRTVDQAREVVHEAMEAHNLDRTLNPLRNLLARCRPRLHDFGIDIGSRRGLGYQLHRI